MYDLRPSIRHRLPHLRRQPLALGVDHHRRARGRVAEHEPGELRGGLLAAEAERREAREERAATLMAAAWRGHVCREGAKALERLIASSHEPTDQEKDEARHLQEWMEAEAEAQGLTVEELMRREREEDSACMSMAELNRRNEAEAARWDETDWGEDDRQEREWEEYKATRRLERMWG